MGDTRKAEIQEAVMPHISDLLTAVLLLANKDISMRRTHRLQIVLAEGGTLVETAKAVEMSQLVTAMSEKSIMPVGCDAKESSAGEIIYGTSDHLKKEARQRNAEYFPVIVVENGSCICWPMFLTHDDLRRIENRNWTREQHLNLLAEIFGRMRPIPNSKSQNGASCSSQVNKGESPYWRNYGQKWRSQVGEVWRVRPAGIE